MEDELQGYLPRFLPAPLLSLFGARVLLQISRGAGIAKDMTGPDRHDRIV